MNFRFFLSALTSSFLLFSLAGYSKEAGRLPPIEGNYEVVEITSKDDRYLTFFRKEGESSPCLSIQTQAKPIGLQLNQTYKLRAEILRRSEKMTEASELLVFFSTAQGRTPISLLSAEQPVATFAGKLLDYDHPGFLTF